MLFVAPYALAGLATVVGLLAVYTFRSRFRRRPVSSLMLWHQSQRPRTGGAHRERLRLPPLFYLELAILIILILAALGPHMRRPDVGSLIVVLDNSASMSARDERGQTALDRSVKRLAALLKSTRYTHVRLLLASSEGPVSAGYLAPSRAVADLQKTPCLGSGDSIHATLARAGELAETTDDILVLTDRAPETTTSLQPGVRWIACGKPQPNAAITTAARTWHANGQETVLIAVADFGYGATTVPLRVQNLDSGSLLFEGQVMLTPEGHGQQRLTLPPHTPAIAVELPADALTIDNHAILISEQPRPLAVSIQINDDALRRVVVRALTATGRVVLNAATPKLSFTDTNLPDTTPDAPWQFVITRPESPRLMRGPYLADRTQPLLEGVSFAGLVWPTGTNNLPGRIILFSGSAPLLSIYKALRGTTSIHLISAGANDALYRSPAWPALVWNTIQTCTDAQPGPMARNLHAGVPARFATDRLAKEALFATPEGELHLRTQSGSVIWTPTLPGYYHQLLADNRREAFAVNFRASGESELRQLQSGQWGGAQDTRRLQRTHQSVAWIAGMAALMLAGAHHGLLGQWSRPGGVPRSKRRTQA